VLQPTIGRPHFTPQLRSELIRDFTVMRANLETQAEQVLDARSPARFRGEEAEPRPGVRAGHKPGAVKNHYTEVLTPEGTMRSPGELISLFAQRGVDLERPVVTSCGSGITAAILSLALDLAGAKHTALYDGSWSEWGARSDAPVATGA
jgi:thiosulfate/3-mercaptopyruvate sulfurtransferase